MLTAFEHKLGDTQTVSNYLLPSMNEAGGFSLEIDWNDSIKSNDLKCLWSLPKVMPLFELRLRIIEYPAWIELVKNLVISWVNAFLW